jgi:hypothetical protein
MSSVTATVRHVRRRGRSCGVIESVEHEELRDRQAAATADIQTMGITFTLRRA